VFYLRIMIRVFLCAVFAFSVFLVPVNNSIGGGHVAQAATTWTVQQDQYMHAVLDSEIGGTCTSPSGHVFTANPAEIMLDCGDFYASSVAPNTFMNMFSDAFPDTIPPVALPAPIYDALTAIETVSREGDPEGLGYGFQAAFDLWREKGLIN
jgi:hypothetical protein